MNEDKFKFKVFRKDGRKLIPLAKYVEEDDNFYLIAQNPELVIKENGKDVTKQYKSKKKSKNK